MKITLLTIGSTPKNYLLEGEKIFEKRIQNYVSFEKIELPDLKKTKNLTHEQIKNQEGKQIMLKLSPSDYVVLLDERGKEMRSLVFAEWMQQIMNQGPKQLVFVVGGAYGFSSEVYQRANQKISLSAMTFSHQMVRLFFMEQLYRAFSILRNEPYHHE
jgi:23S rRNA (pseudouridine1915-N3)-methyltransferase